MLTKSCGRPRAVNLIAIIPIPFDAAGKVNLLIKLLRKMSFRDTIET